MNRVGWLIGIGLVVGGALLVLAVVAGFVADNQACRGAFSQATTAGDTSMILVARPDCAQVISMDRADARRGAR